MFGKLIFKHRKPAVKDLNPLREQQVRRTETIKTICNKHMDRSKPPLGRFRTHCVSVPYEDLLRIWDKAQHIREDL